MIVVALAMFAAAAALLFFAFRPKLAFYLDEGWKFRDNPEPSDAYVGINGVVRVLGAVFLIVLGIIFMVDGFREWLNSDEKAATQAAEDRCNDEILPRFEDAIEWNYDNTVANENVIRQLAQELGVEVAIENHPVQTSYGTSNWSAVKVSDPQRPGDDKLVLTFVTRYLSPVEVKACNDYRV